MKAVGVCLALVSLFSSSADAARLADADKSAAVGKVVKMLQEMLKQSQEDWKSDKEAYGAFKCYCDDNADKKTKAIQEATTSISLLTNKIDGLQGSNGALSIQTSQLEADMAANKQTQSEATSLREKEEKAFQEESADLTAAISQMGEAIKLLSDIGADQTSSSNADHEKFMGKYKENSLVRLQSSVRLALTAASSFIDPSKKAKILAFLQAPFTGAYTAQSGQIVGILKSLKDTFKENLESAKAKEKTSKEASEEFMKNKEDEHANLKTSYDTKQANLGTNDGDLSTKKMQLQQFAKQMDEDKEFLGTLTAQCADKKKAYENRKVFAANEDLALSQAIALLDNDVASGTFGAVDATSKGKTGSLLQLKSASAPQSKLALASELLQREAAEQHSPRLKKLLVLLQAGNPFTVVLQQIDKMVKLVDGEQTVDEDQKAFCEKTNEKNSNNLGAAKDSLNAIEADITKLKADINDPLTGMKTQMTEAEESLKTNLKNQATETSTRRKENIAYQKDVSTMGDAISMLSKAETMLTGYYDTLDNEQVGLMQRGPTPPETFKGAYKGQNDQAKKVLSMLAFIRSETAKEEQVAHDGELKSQHDYEDSMKALVDGEASLQESIAKLNADLASTEKGLLEKHADQDNTERSKITLERYIKTMKPGCDFILKNYDDRTKSRALEKKSLQEVKAKLKTTPAFKAK